MRRTSIRLICMTVIVLGSGVGPAAAESELELSTDGVHWVNAISDLLFDPSMRWVPGDSEDATFFIRNRGGSSADLTVDVLSDSLGDLIDSGYLHITAKGGGGHWTPVSAPGKHRLLTTPHVPDGQVMPIDVNVRFDIGADNPTELRASTLNFIVTLTESAGDSGDGLPDTGAPDLRWYAAIGAIFIGTGLALVTRRARPSREAHHV
jgi:hypothetical protein